MEPFSLVKLFSPRTSFLSLGYMEILIILVSSLGIIGFIICLIMVSIQFNSLAVIGIIICLIMVSFQFNSLVVHLLGVLNNTSIPYLARVD